MSQPELITRPVETAEAAALTSLVRHGIANPQHLDVYDVLIQGSSRPDVVRLDIQDGSVLRLETPHSPSRMKNIEPNDWTPDNFTALVGAAYTLRITKGALDVTRHHFATDASSLNTQSADVYGWEWEVIDGDESAVLWAAALRFSSAKVPKALWYPNGNLILKSSGDLTRGWRFCCTAGKVFLVPHGRAWAIAFAGPARPSSRFVQSVLSAIGFIFGEPLAVGVFHAVTQTGPGNGRFAIPFGRIEGTAGNEAPALPVSADAWHFASFIDAMLEFEAATPGGGTLRVATSHYFASLATIAEAEFSLSWIGAESVAKWGKRNGHLRATVSEPIADHEKWREWLELHKGTIIALARQGEGGELYGRLFSLDADKKSIVEKVFRGEGIEWTAEMAEAQRVRHSVIHEGVIPNLAQDWERAFALIGLVRTMTTALIARVVGYSGPIADRSRTYNNLVGEHEPSWWKSASFCEAVVYSDAPADTAG